MIEYTKGHPDGPYMYSEWSSIPDNVEFRERWFYYFDLYKPMVEENNICHIDISESSLIKGTLSKDVCMSLFTGVEQYICISNLGNCAETIVFNDIWQDRETGECMKEITLPVQRVKFFRRIRS